MRSNLQQVADPGLVERRDEFVDALAEVSSAVDVRRYHRLDAEQLCGSGRPRGGQGQRSTVFFGRHAGRTREQHRDIDIADPIGHLLDRTIAALIPFARGLSKVTQP